MLEIGSVIDGKYKILNVIGKGGMSVVYLAMNERANKQWAIKEVRKDGVQNFEVVKQNLVVETELLKKLSHPNLPSIIDVIDGEETFLIVMDYIEGNPLSKALEETGAQNQDDVIEWAKQLCDVLGYLHSRKPPIIYRDMKPSNVMLKPDGNVMLIDFGTAREFKSNKVEDTTCLGTIGYAAPEQYGGHGQTDARTDIYNLGATMYHLVTGQSPDPAKPPYYGMRPIREFNPMLSSGLEEIILKCTQDSPEERYQSCAELLYALDNYTEIDEDAKRTRTLKWNLFLTSFITTVVMLIGTIGFAAGATVQKSSTYDNYINEAEIADSQSEKEELYRQAIKTDPARTDAYEDLLDCYTNNSSLSDNEYTSMSLLIKENEEVLMAASAKDYAEKIAFPLAQTLFLNYEPASGDSLSGITKSAAWFNKVEQSAQDEKIKNKSNILQKISDNYQYVGKDINPNTGESVISQEEYWQNLMDLNNLAQSENDLVALMIYKNISSQLMEKYDWLKDGNITPDKIYSLAEDVKKNSESLEKKNNNAAFAVDISNACKSNVDSLENLISDKGKGAE